MEKGRMIVNNEKAIFIRSQPSLWAWSAMSLIHKPFLLKSA